MLSEAAAQIDPEEGAPRIDISIIMPCFNHGGYLREALASVDAYAGNNHEIIIINDGSTELDTLQTLVELDRQGYVIINQTNHGLAHARNTGISAAQGRYILPLDADNKIRPVYITKAIEILDQFPEVGIVYGDVQYFGEQNLVWALPDFDLDRLMLGNFIDACAVFRKQVWHDCGGYDPNMPDRLGYEDWDFWLGAAAKGWQFYHLNTVTYDYRVRSDSMVQACKLPQNQQRLVQYICQKHESLYKPKYAEVIAAKELATFEQVQKVAELQLQLAESMAESDRLNQALEQQQANLIQEDYITELAQVKQSLARCIIALDPKLDLSSQTSQASQQIQPDLATQTDLGDALAKAEALQAELNWMKTSKFWRSRELIMGLKRKLKTILGFKPKS
jgi:GT2 family glycosyltransferase